jgi:hypothetical protein
MKSLDRGNNYDIPATAEERKAFEQTTGRFTFNDDGQRIERKKHLKCQGMIGMYYGYISSSASFVALDKDDQSIQDKRK